MENRVRTQLVQSFLAALKQERLPWRQCWTTVRPTSFSTGKPYRGVNGLLLSHVAHERGYEDPRWMTYRQAQANGWQVRKGEKSVLVEYWQYYDVRLKTKIERSELERIQREEPERIKDIRFIWRHYPVFNAQQIDGVPAWVPPRSEAHPELLLYRREQLLSNLKIGFRELGNEAYYSPHSDTITMPPAERFRNDYGYTAVLLHEAGHATGHSSRLGRDLEHKFGTPEYAKEELRAEIASAFVAQELRLPSSAADEIENHSAYIQSWIALLETDPKELFDAVKDAEQIADYLQEHGKLQELTAEPEERPAWEPSPEEEEELCL